MGQRLKVRKMTRKDGKAKGKLVRRTTRRRPK